MLSDMSQRVRVGQSTYVVEGYDYPNGQMSKIDYNEALARLHDVTVMRTHSEDGTQFKMFVCYPLPNEPVENFKWRGTPFIPTDQQIDWCIMRRLAEGAKAQAEGAEAWMRDTHYEKDNPRMPG